MGAKGPSCSISGGPLGGHPLSHLAGVRAAVYGEHAGARAGSPPGDTYGGSLGALIPVLAQLARIPYGPGPLLAAL